MTTGTVRLQRVLRAPPERVYRAFLEADALVRWLPPYGFTCQVHQLDARVGTVSRWKSARISRRASPMAMAPALVPGEPKLSNGNTTARVIAVSKS